MIAKTAKTATAPTRPPARRPRALARRALAAAGTALLAGGLAPLVPLLPIAPAAAAVTAFPVTSRISVSTSGAQSGPGGLDGVLVDGSGRYALFRAGGALAPDDANGDEDAYLRDRVAGTTTLVSVTTNEAVITGPSAPCGLSDDGRYVAFWSAGTNLPAGGTGQIYLRDRVAGTTSIVSVSSAEAAGQVATPGGDVLAGGIFPDQACPVSDDGRYVAFTSRAANLVGGDTNDEQDVFRRDRLTTTTRRISVAGDGTQGNGRSQGASMSATAAVIVFESEATNLVPGDTNGAYDVFQHLPDNPSPSTGRLSVDAAFAQVAAGGRIPAISGDLSTVVFSSSAPDLVPGDDNGHEDVFARSRITGDLELVSVASNGAAAEGFSRFPSVSDDGRHVAFSSTAANLYVGDGNGTLDTYRRDRTLGRTDLVSRGPGLAAGSSQSESPSSVSDDGSVVGFSSAAPDLVRGDTNSGADAFVRDFSTDAAPFGSFDAVVTQQFADFEGRPPTAAERAEWRARLVHGELSPDGLIDALAHRPAFAGRRAPVARLYWAVFLRPPDRPGLDHWVGQLDAGRSLASIATLFTKTPEFTATYGPGLPNGAFVTAVYQNVFRRAPDAAGLAFWTQQLDQKTRTRGTVMTGFSESAEGVRVLAPQVDLILVSLGMTGQVVSQLAIDVGAHAIRGGKPIEAFVAEYRLAPSYQARVTP